MSVKYPVWAKPGTIDILKKLSNQYVASTRMISTSKGIFLYRFGNDAEVAQKSWCHPVGFPG